MQRMVAVSILCLLLAAGACESDGRRAAAPPAGSGSSAGSLNAAAPASPTAVVPVPPAAASAPPAPAPPLTEGRALLWIVDGDYTGLVAVDPQTGEVVNQVKRSYAMHVSSADGRRQYFVEARKQFVAGARPNEWWDLWVSVLDVTRAGIVRTIPLARVPASSPVPFDDASPADLALADDDRRLFVTQVERVDERWVTRVYMVDTLLGRMEQSLAVFADPLPEQQRPVPADGPNLLRPPVQSLLSADGRKLFVAQNRPRRDASPSLPHPLWSTRIAVLDLDSRQIERIVDVPQEVPAAGLWLGGVRSPDGQALYFVQEIVRSGHSEGYRFLSFDPHTFSITDMQLVERGSGGEPVCGNRLGHRFTPDGRYLLRYWGGSPQNPETYFQFLDTQTGLIGYRVPFERTAGAPPPGVWLMTEFVFSADKRLPYAVDLQTREIAVLDLEQRAIVRRAVLDEPNPGSSRRRHPFSGWFVRTASAKMVAQPGIVLSADGERLYFVDLESMEKGNGLWGVATATLKPIGHWLRGKDITGIQLSDDGAELYALSPNDQTIYALDALSGDTRRTFARAVNKPYGFAVWKED